MTRNIKTKSTRSSTMDLYVVLFRPTTRVIQHILVVCVGLTFCVTIAIPISIYSRSAATEDGTESVPFRTRCKKHSFSTPLLKNTICRQEFYWARLRTSPAYWAARVAIPNLSLILYGKLHAAPFDMHLGREDRQASMAFVYGKGRQLNKKHADTGQCRQYKLFVRISSSFSCLGRNTQPEWLMVKPDTRPICPLD
jgi:hypothetical protein